MSKADTRHPPGPTPAWERRLIDKAKRGDRAAQAELLRLHEPLTRQVAKRMYLPGGQRADLAQYARMGVVAAIRVWDPERQVPFRALAWLFAIREVRMAVNSARSGKHRPLNSAHPLHEADGYELPPQEHLEATERPDEDPVAKALARERLQEIVDRTKTLTPLERRCLALSANGYGHREIAAKLGVRPRAVNNALQRVRRKVLGR